MKYLIISLFSLLISSANTCNKKNQAKINTSEKIDQEYQRNKFYITTLNKKDIAKEKLHIILDDEKKTISGFSGCNTFSCSYTIEKNTILSFGFPRSTKVYCVDKQQLEEDFLKTLLQSKIRILRNDSLVLKNNDHHELLIAVKSPK